MSYKFSIPDGWVEAELDEFCTKVADGTHDSPKRTESGKLLVTSKNIIGGILDLSTSYRISEDNFNEINRRSKVDLNDVLLSMIGTVGEVCLIEQEPDFAIKNVGLLKNEDYLRARWLYFYLTSPQAQAQIKERLRGTTQQYLPLGEIRKFPIILPQDRSVMQSIVEILGALHDKIRLNHKINQTLEQMAQAIFKSWFVDFEPVKTKITVLEAGGSAEDALLAAMQAISGKNEALLNQLQTEQPEQYAELRATAELFPSAMQGSELGEIPEGWEFRKLANICKVLNGRAYKNSEFKDSGIPIVRIQNLSGKGSTVFSDLDLPQDKLIAKEDFIYAWSATFGPFIWRGPKSIYHYHIWKMDVQEKIVSRYFLYLTMFRKTEHMKNAGTGSIFTHLTKRIMEEQDILIGSQRINDRFSSIVYPIFKQISSLNDELINLENMRDVLLPKLLSGELRLPEVEGQIQEAADAV